MMDTTPKFETDHVLITLNPLTGHYLLTAKAGTKRLEHHAYYSVNLTAACGMAQTMEHYEKTGEIQQFKSKRNFLKPYKGTI